MAQGIFVAEVIDDQTGYGGQASAQLSNMAATLGLAPEVPIGTVQFRTAGQSPTEPSGEGYASPLLPQHTKIPLVGEFIVVIPGPAKNATHIVNSTFYYLGPVALANNKNQNKMEGALKRATQAVGIGLPTNLIPKKKVLPLQPTGGDVLFQGRNGGSIRFTSTQSSGMFGEYVPSGKDFPWKKSSAAIPGVGAITGNGQYDKGAVGNPLIAITCGLGKGSKTLVENNVEDKSCIYLTTDQKLEKVKLAQKDVGGKYPANHRTSLATAPVGGVAILNANHQIKMPNAFDDSQVFINGDRILLNAKKDSVILVAEKDIKMCTKYWSVDLDPLMGTVQTLQAEYEALANHTKKHIELTNALVRVISQIQFPTAVGPTGPCLDTYFQQLKSISDALVGGKKLWSKVDDRENEVHSLRKKYEKMKRKKGR